MTKILLTGFEPFDEVKVNPSQLIVEHFKQQKHADLITEVLPVAYDVAGERIKNLLHEHQPDVVIMLGVAQKQETIKLERIAVNINDATIPDNEGKHEAGKRIVDDAPVAFWSTLPLDDVFEAIAKAEIPVAYSNHAGAYLCNHVFYVARHTLEMTGRGSVPCGFIHLPSVETMPIEMQIQAIGICLQQFQNATGFSKLLKQLADKLPISSRHIQLQNMDIVRMGMWGDGSVEYDRVAAMTGACVSLSERLLSELRCGDFRYAIISSEQEAFICIELSDHEDLLSMCVRKITSFDNLIRQLSANIDLLNSPLCHVDYDIAGDLKLDTKDVNYSHSLTMRYVSLEQFMMPPRELAVITVDGLILAGVPEDKMREQMRHEEADRISPMAAAGLSLGERISSEIGMGMLDEVIVNGTKGTFILTPVGEEAVLAAIYDRVVSLDRLRSQLRDVANAVAEWV